MNVMIKEELQACYTITGITRIDNFNIKTPSIKIKCI